jgi:hypothetical protein
MRGCAVARHELIPCRLVASGWEIPGRIEWWQHVTTILLCQMFRQALLHTSGEFDALLDFRVVDGEAEAGGGREGDDAALGAHHLGVEVLLARLVA